MATVLVNLSLVGTSSLLVLKGGGFEFSNFLQKGVADFSHKKGGVGKLGELF